jgi:lactate permease
LMLGVFRTAAHWAALGGLVASLLVAVLFYAMPSGLVLSAGLNGAVFGLWPIVWIVINALFLHNLTVETGRFDIVRESLASLTTDRRIQALIIAFAFGALLEGIAGFGAPVAITAAIMASLGFNPLYAASIALLANTAPVAFGSLGVPVTTLGGLVAPIVGNEDTGAVTNALSAMIGRQLPLFSIIIPGFMIFVMAGWRGMTQVMPAVLTAGISFAVTQFITANFLGPILVDVLSALVCLAALVGLLRVWQPSVVWRFEDEPEEGGESREAPAGGRPATGPASGFAAGGASFGGGGSSFQAFLPYIILVVVVIIAKIGTISKSIPDWLNVTALLQKATIPIEWPGLHNLVIRVPPSCPPRRRTRRCTAGTSSTPPAPWCSSRRSWPGSSWVRVPLPS